MFKDLNPAIDEQYSHLQTWIDEGENVLNEYIANSSFLTSIDFGGETAIPGLDINLTMIYAHGQPKDNLDHIPSLKTCLDALPEGEEIYGVMIHDVGECDYPLPFEETLGETKEVLSGMRRYHFCLNTTDKMSLQLTQQGSPLYDENEVYDDTIDLLSDSINGNFILPDSPGIIVSTYQFLHHCEQLVMWNRDTENRRIVCLVDTYTQSLSLGNTDFSTAKLELDRNYDYMLNSSFDSDEFTVTTSSNVAFTDTQDIDRLTENPWTDPFADN